MSVGDRAGPDARAETEGDGSEPVAELFQANVKLADQLARRYSSHDSLDEDLRQVAHLGLLLAARRFDPDKGRFLRFASLTIVGELKKHLRSHGWAVHVPRSLQEDSITVAAVVDELTNVLGRNPLVSEISERTGLSVERVTEALRVRHARFRSAVEPAGSDAGAIDDVPQTALLNTALESLDTGTRNLIRMRFDDGLTQREIAGHLGVSQPEVHRRLRTALTQLKHQLDTYQNRPKPS